MSKGKIYLAGPMTAIGPPDYNYPRFVELSEEWEKRGWAVHNPATSYNGRTDLDYRLYMQAAINLLMQAEAIALMDRWEESRGAKMEALIAQRLGLDFYNAETGRRMEVAPIEVAEPEILFHGDEPYGRNEGLIQRLVPLAQELSENNAEGVTVSDLRLEALKRGLLTGEETGEELSALGQVMKRAGLVHFNTTRRSEVDSTHGRWQMVWFEDISYKPLSPEEQAVKERHERGNKAEVLVGA